MAGASVEPGECTTSARRRLRSVRGTGPLVATPAPTSGHPIESKVSNQYGMLLPVCNRGACPRIRLHV